MNVGQGIKDAMSAAGDYPVQDSQFITNSDGTSTERGYGLKGIYIASNASGSWQSAGPLPVAS